MNKLDINNIPLDDKKTYDMLSRGLTNGVFQLESDGMRSLCKRLQPSEIKHLDAIVALYRPSSIQFIEPYIKFKNNPELTEYIDERVKHILEDTYSTMVYQEQMMQVAQILAGYSMAEADSLRRACGKKNMEEMLSHREQFIKGCVDNNFEEKKAIKLFDQIVEFANYSFNRSHSISYATIAYQTAYLKANFTLEYMTSLLNKSFKEEYMDECYMFNIDILPPDINFSEYQFKHDKENNCIRFGFGGLKGLGESAVNSLVLERKNGKFTSFKNIITRIPSISKANLEVLIKSGALNTIEENPYKYLALLEKEYLSKAKIKSEYKRGEISLFDMAIKLMALDNLKDETLDKLKENLKNIKGAKKEDKEKKELIKSRIKEIEDTAISNFVLPEIDLSKEQVKENEVELMGFSLTYNPKKVLVQLMDFFNVDKLIDIKENRNYFQTYNCLLELKNIKKTKTGSYIAVFADNTAEISSFLSKDFYNQNEHLLVKNNIFYTTCQLRESKNPAFDDGLKVENLRLFSINSVEDEIYLINNSDDENLKNFLTKVYNSANINNMDIKYRLTIENNSEIIETNVDYWVDDIKSISSDIIRYNFKVGKRSE